MHCMHGIQGVQTLALFVFVFKFRQRMPSASSPASSRARVVLLLEVRVGVAEGRLVTYIGELALGPLPCQMSQDGDVFNA